MVPTYRFTIVSDFNRLVNEKNVFASRDLLGDGPDGVDRDDCRKGDHSNVLTSCSACFKPIPAVKRLGRHVQVDRIQVRIKDKAAPRTENKSEGFNHEL